jgi:hypothetical protein
MNSCSSGPGSYCSFAFVYCLSGEAAAVQFSLFFVTIGFFIRYREAIESALRTTVVCTKLQTIKPRFWCGCLAELRDLRVESL